MKKFVITGGSGFIGSNLINFLLKKNFLIINIDKGSYVNNAYNINLSQNDKYFFFKTDINNKSKVFNILKRFKPDGIFNLAAETHVDRSIDNPSEFIKSNILGVYNLLENIRDYKKKFKKDLRLLHVSTDEVYGDIKGKKGLMKITPIIQAHRIQLLKQVQIILLNLMLELLVLKQLFQTAVIIMDPVNFLKN